MTASDLFALISAACLVWAVALSRHHETACLVLLVAFVALALLSSATGNAPGVPS